MGFREFHKRLFACAAYIVCAGAFLAIPAAATTSSNAGIPQDGLVAYYPFTGGSLENAVSPATNDAGSSNTGDGATTAPQAAENKGATFGPDRFGNENSAAVFSGDSNCYMEIPDHDAFSIGTAGALTISVWVSPKVLTFRNAEAAGYVHWMGKGVPHQHEWVLRMYNKELTASQENRPNRMSAYAFNLEGGLGSGSYVQEELTAGEWMHIAARYDVASNTITLFKNGVQKDQDPLYDETYGVQVQNGTAPVRLGTRSLWSFFEGSIDDLRLRPRTLRLGNRSTVQRAESSRQTRHFDQRSLRHQRQRHYSPSLRHQRRHLKHRERLHKRRKRFHNHCHPRFRQFPCA